ncbi:MAG: hypothetical protein LBQ50_00700, partial [Planctomycetaceae bacterium]|nr:hypothetical protein [Planctomycetaceae bacterium]
MIRSSFLSCVLLTIFNFALALAQESPSTETPFPPASLKATPEILALIAESHQLLEQLPEEERAMALFQVLELQFLFADKQPARKTIQEILALIPSIEKDSVRTQICEATAVILAELGDFGQCVQTLNQITKPVDRAEKQLNVAEQILNNAEMTKTPISFDMTGLLQSALTGAVEAKDKGLESLVSIVLARELAKQGKIEESKILFESARKKAREIEEIEEQNLIGFMVRSMIGVGMQPEAMAMIETVTEEDAKRLLMGQAAVAMAQEGKTKDAGVLVKTFKPGDMKDNVLVRVAETAAKTITVEQILELAKQTASPESREKFLERTFLALLENKRDDAASELAGHSENAPEYQKRLQLWQLESLIDEKKFAEAEKNIATLSPDSATFPPELKQSLLRQLILIEIQAKGLSNELLNRLTATFSEEDEKNRALLQAEAEKAAKMDDFNESMLSLEQIIQSQIQMLDLQSAAKTFRLLFEIAA